MRIQIGQIYAEPGAAFRVASGPLQLIASELQATSFRLSNFESRYEGQELTLVLLVTATTHAESLAVKGPVFRRSKPEVEFAVWIPFAQGKTPLDTVMYVANSAAQAIRMLCERYAQPEPDLEHYLPNVRRRLREVAGPLTHQRDA